MHNQEIVLCFVHIPRRTLLNDIVLPIGAPDQKIITCHSGGQSQITYFAEVPFLFVLICYEARQWMLANKWRISAMRECYIVHFPGYVCFTAEKQVG